MKKGIKIFIYKTLLFTLPVLVVFEVLFRLGYFPVITDSSLFDTKMMEVQKLHLKNVKVITIGSSITLYELKSDIITQDLNTPYYNLASWGLHIADMRILLKDFVKEYDPQYVIICSTIGDFKMPADSTYLSYTNAGSYIKTDLPEWFYFKNYSSVYRIIHRKHFGSPVKLDKWGGASLTINKNAMNRKPLDDVFPTAYTQANYNALDSLSHFLQQKNIQLVFIQAPIKSSYANTDAYRQRINTHFDKCQAIVEKNGGTYLNYYDTKIFTDSLFVDQYHLQDAGSVILTKEVVTDLKKIIK